MKTLHIKMLCEAAQDFAISTPMLRGAIGGKLACINSNCNNTCTNCKMFADNNPVRCYTLQTKKQTLDAEDTFTVNIRLFGDSISIYKDIVKAIVAIGKTGLYNSHGRFSLISAQSVNIYTGVKTAVIQDGKFTDSLTITTLEDAANKAKDLLGRPLVLKLKSPTQIVQRKQLLKQFDSKAFISRLVQRRNALLLHQASQDAPDFITPLALDHKATTEMTAAFSSSKAKGHKTDLSGITGRVQLAPVEDIDLLTLLVYGETIAVGKNAAKGNGAYTLTTA